MTVRPLVFTDCESTSLDRRTRLPWEAAIIRRDPATGADTEHTWMATDVDPDAADPVSLDVGRFWERHPAGGKVTWDDVKAAGVEPVTLSEMALQIQYLTRGKATLLGAVVSFDEETYDWLLHRNGLTPAWHHRLVDVRVYAAGVAGVDPGWGFEDALAEFGLAADDATRHTALGDARLARDVYDAAREQATRQVNACRAAVAWRRRHHGGRPVDLLHVGADEAALVGAVDALPHLGGQGGVSA